MPHVTVPPLAIRPREAARRLGISERTLWEWTKRGLIPHVRIGTGKRLTTLYSVPQLESWLQGQFSCTKGGAQ
jgi:excisionase family DNA binding protein